MKTQKKQEDSFEFCFGLFVRYYDRKNDKWRVKMNLKRFAIALAFAFIGLWILTATTVYCGLKYLRKYEYISYIQVLKNPLSTDTFRIQMGKAQISKAYECLKNSNFQEGFINLVHGTARNPNDLEARLLLAQMYMTLLKDSKRACETLEFRIVKAFEEKNKSYLCTSIYYFSMIDDFRLKSVKLLSRCAKHNIVQQKTLHSVLLTLLKSLYKEKKYDEIIGYCKELTNTTDDNVLKSIAIKNSALTLAHTSRSNEAIKLLQENNILSGDVVTIVKITSLIENEDEISAAKLLKMAMLNMNSTDSVYEIHTILAEDFGDKKSAKQSRDMIKILSGKIVNKDLESFSKDTSENLPEKIEKYIETNPNRINELCAAAISSKNLHLINSCLKIKTSPNTHFALSLAKAELLLLNKDTREASVVLDSARYSDYVKVNKLEHLFDGFDIATNALSNKNVFENIDTFVKKHQIAESISLAKLFDKIGLNAHSIYLLRKTLDKYPHDIRVSSHLATTAFDEGDMQTIVEAYERYSIRIPIKILAQMKSKFQSDRYLFYSQKTIASLIKKSEQAQEKIEQYKKIFGNF